LLITASFKFLKKVVKRIIKKVGATPKILLGRLKIIKKLLTLLFFAFGANLGLVATPASNLGRQDADEAFFKLKVAPTQKEYDTAYANVRKFIWEHWTSNRDGTVFLESYTKEGQRVLSAFKIKVVPNDISIDVSIEREYFDRRTQKSVKSTTSYSGKEIERVKKPKNGLAIRETVSREASISPESYFLRIKNDKKEILTEF